MPYKTPKIFTALFSLFLSACVAHNDTADFDKRQAAKARVELALGYLAQQNNQQAKQNLDKALAYAPDDYLVHSALAYFYQRQGDVANARKSYLKALDLDNKQGDVYNNYGTFLCGQGEFAAAYAQFNAALNTPNYYHQADTYENIALCALSEKNAERYAESIAALEKADKSRAERLKQQNRFLVQSLIN